MTGTPNVSRNSSVAGQIKNRLRTRADDCHWGLSEFDQISGNISGWGRWPMRCDWRVICFVYVHDPLVSDKGSMHTPDTAGCENSNPSPMRKVHRCADRCGTIAFVRYGSGNIASGEFHHVAGTRERFELLIA